MLKEYKIGDFAKELGVTHDFLKHYEQYGILEPNISQSGYRYYLFSQSARVLECIKFKNWGFSVKEIEFILNQASLEEIIIKIGEKCKDIGLLMDFYSSLMDYSNTIGQRKTEMEKGYKLRWYVVNKPAFYFLPHSYGDSFIPDDRIRRLVGKWTSFMPMVVSLQKIRYLEKVSFETLLENKSVCWGLAVSSKFVSKHHIPVEPPVEYFPEERCLECHLVEQREPGDIGRIAINQSLEQALELTDTLSQERKGEYIFRDIVIQSQFKGLRRTLATVYVPLT